VRYGILADVHGNLHALRAVLRELERAGVDRLLLAGDLVGYGPQPNECVELVAELDAVCVAGNHDLIALGALPDERCIRLARDSLRWTRTVLTPAAREFLAGLPLQAQAPGGVVVAHGSLDDPQEYTTRPQQADRQLAALPAGARLLVVGHTHRPWAYGARSGSLPSRGTVPFYDDPAVLLNPGAVGQSRELRARARCAVLDLQRGSALFLAVPYDVDRCREDLRRLGLSPRGCHLRPSVLGAGRRAVRRLAERAQRRSSSRERSRE
jgi:predicted phosphodiesterase